MAEDNLVIKPKRPKGEDGYRVFSIRVREDIVDKIDLLSSESGRSRNELITILLEYALERCVVEKTERP